VARDQRTGRKKGGLNGKNSTKKVAQESDLISNKKNRKQQGSPKRGSSHFNLKRRKGKGGVYQTTKENQKKK